MTDQEKCELVAREFGALMEKHELAGMFVACAKTHATHSLLLESAPWVRLKIEDDESGAMIGIRIKSKIDDYLAAGLTKEVAETRQNQEMGYTINMLDMLSSQIGPVALLSIQMIEALEKRFHIKTTSKRVGDATG
jgi:hypothetical protein